MGVAEAQFFEDAFGSAVFRVMTGEQAFQLKRAEGVIDDGLRRFGGKTFSPKLRKEVEAELEDLPAGFVRTETATASEGVLLKEEDGPVLEFMGELVGDFTGEAFEDLGFREGAAEGAGDLEIAPEGEGQRDVGHRPCAETEAGGAEKISAL